MNPEFLKVRDLLEGLQKCDPDSCVQVGYMLVLAGKAPVTIRSSKYPFLVTKIDHNAEASHKISLDNLKERIVDLCFEFEESDGDMSITEFIARLRKAAQ